MSTTRRSTSIAAPNSADVLIADVPWPRHKLYAVIAGLVTLVLLGTRCRTGAQYGAGSC
ncbi:hypothetical protein [Mycobacterium simiae]|uniref:hypothetical protein n=1 Tax=Mycobacterium simiae TaxID=1784 RepID=UPI0021CDC31C|nr:hypothetical protein [Mycobacterium simiae]